MAGGKNERGKRMNYTVTVYKCGAAIETHWCDSLEKTGPLSNELKRKYPGHKIEIDEV